MPLLQLVHPSCQSTSSMASQFYRSFMASSVGRNFKFICRPWSKLACHILSIFHVFRTVGGSIHTSVGASSIRSSVFSHVFPSPCCPSSSPCLYLPRRNDFLRNSDDDFDSVVHHVKLEQTNFHTFPHVGVVNHVPVKEKNNKSIDV